MGDSFGPVRMPLVRPLVLAVTVALTGAVPAAAQRADSTAPRADSLPPRAAWVDVGIGPGTMPNDLGLIVSTLSVGAERPGGQLVLGRLLYGEEFCILGCTGEEPARTTELGVLYGFMSRGRWLTVSAAGGVALLHGTRYDAPATDGSWSSHTVTTLGVPAEMAVVVTPARTVGVGLTGRLDLNPNASLLSIALGVRLGRLAPRAAPRP